MVDKACVIFIGENGCFYGMTALIRYNKSKVCEQIVAYIQYAHFHKQVVNSVKFCDVIKKQK